MFSRPRILIKDILSSPKDYLDQTIQVSGWIETIRTDERNTGVTPVALYG